MNIYNIDRILQNSKLFLPCSIQREDYQDPLSTEFSAILLGYSVALSISHLFVSLTHPFALS